MECINIRPKQIGAEKKENCKFTNVQVLNLLMLFPFFVVRNAYQYSGSSLSRLFSCEKDMFCRFMNDGNVKWRKLLYAMNLQQSVDGIYVYKDEDAKRPYVEKYGERAKNAVMVITTAPDTLCDAYVQQHPELMQTRHRIEGYVIESDTEKPLSDTWINYSYKNVGDTWIKHTDGVGAATDSTGHFVLWPPRKDVKLQATRTGYVTVRIDQPADTTLTIRMTNATIIKDVEVVPKSTIRIRGNE